MKNKVRLSNQELINIIIYALRENLIDDVESRLPLINDAIKEYKMLCEYFRKNYILKGNLDTFKLASCLLVAVNNREFSNNKFINASIAIDAACKMCEKPYINVGKNFDIPQELETVSFKDYIELYQTAKGDFMRSLVYENGRPITYCETLELLYTAALETKHKQTSDVYNGTVLVKTIGEDTKIKFGNMIGGAN